MSYSIGTVVQFTGAITLASVVLIAQPVEAIKLKKLVDTATSFPDTKKPIAVFREPVISDRKVVFIADGKVESQGQNTSQFTGLYAFRRGKLESVDSGTSTSKPSGTGKVGKLTNFAGLGIDGNNLLFVKESGTLGFGTAASQTQTNKRLIAIINGKLQTIIALAQQGTNPRQGKYLVASGTIEGSTVVLSTLLNPDITRPSSLILRYQHGQLQEVFQGVFGDRAIRKATIDQGKIIYHTWYTVDQLVGGQSQGIAAVGSKVVGQPYVFGSGSKAPAFDRGLAAESGRTVFVGDVIEFPAIGAITNSGVFVAQNGQINKVVDSRDRVPGENRQFQEFNQPAVSASVITFTENFGANWFAKVDGKIIKIVGVGSKLNGKTVKAFNVSSKPIQNRSVVFAVEFSDETAAVYQADL
jgi:hypothetical protein